jgi:hypothetical protein
MPRRRAGGSQVSLHSFLTSAPDGCDPCTKVNNAANKGLDLFPGGGRVVKLSPHLHLVPELRISGIILLLQTYAFMARTRKVSTLLVNYTPQFMAQSSSNCHIITKL